MIPADSGGAGNVPVQYRDLASVGFAVAVLAGWVVEAAVKWAVGLVLSYFQ